MDEESVSHYFESVDPASINDWCHGTDSAQCGSRSATRQVVWAVLSVGVLLLSFIFGGVAAQYSLNKELAETLGVPVMPASSAVLFPGSFRHDSTLLLRIQDLKQDFESTQLTLQSYLNKKEDPSSSMGANDEIGMSGDSVAWRNEALQHEHSLQQRIRAMSFAKYNLQSLSRMEEGQQQTVLVKFSIRTSEQAEADRYFAVQVAIAAESFAAYYFLEQVYHGLWIGASFQVNAPKVLLARSEASTSAADWMDLGLTSLPRADQIAASDTQSIMSHDKYTLCFFPTGDATMFYINKEMDSLRTEETCFARIVDGFDVVHAMFETNTDGLNYLIQHPYVIEGIQIMDHEDVETDVEDIAKDVYY
jgi:hypothetical protein